MKKIRCEIPDDVYERLKLATKQEANTVEGVAARLICKHVRDEEWRATNGNRSDSVREHELDYGVAKRRKKPKLSAAEKRKAMARLLKFAGCIDSGDPHSGDNDKIDEDLAREYDNDHEEA